MRLFREGFASGAALADKVTATAPQGGYNHFTISGSIDSATNIPTEWDVKTGTNIKWRVKLGSQTYCTPVVANGTIVNAFN